MGVGAGEKLIKLGVTEAVFVVGTAGFGEVEKPNPEGVTGVGTVAVLAAGKVYAGGASDFGTLILEEAVVPNEKVPVGFSRGLVSAEVDVGLVGVWKL